MSIRPGGPSKADLSGTYPQSVDLNSTSPVVDLWQFPLAAFGEVALNSAAIAQDTVTTAPNGATYAVFWDSRKRPQIGKWSTFERTWQLVDLSLLDGNPLQAPESGSDDHHNLVIAVDGDGYIHVVGNMHANALRYIRSTNPNDISAWTTPTGMVGTQESSVTYPQFVRLAGGDLLFFYRDGVSGNGDHYVDRYTTSTKTWARVSQIFKGTAPVSPTECAYINRVAVGTDGTLHLFYLWRVTTDPLTCHDIGYIKSIDGGVTWTTAAGAAQTLPLKPSDSGPFIVTGTPTGLVNQTGASVDSNGVPHACWFLNPSAGVSDLHHLYYSGGAWHNDVVATFPTLSVTRPGTWSDGSGNTFAVYERQGNAKVLQIAPTVGTERDLFPFAVNGWEASFDAFAGNTTLRVLFAPSRTGLTSTYAGVLSVTRDTARDGPPAAFVYPKPIPAAPPAPDPPVAAVPLLPANYYSPQGTRDATGVTVPLNEFRGGVLVAGRACTITNFVCNIAAAGAGSTVRLVAYSLTGKLLAYSAPLDSSTTGVKNATVSMNVALGQAFVIGSVAQGGTAPALTRITSFHDNRIGVTTAAAPFVGNNLPGVSATGITGVPPATVAFGGTGTIPLVAVYAAT